MIKILNLYAGVGGNRKKWENVSVTAIEKDEKIAAVYQDIFPFDTVIACDAHKYLLKHYQEYDFIWSSPPCQTHTKMIKGTRHKTEKTVGYFDASLYQEIVFLQHFYNGKWVVENVIPYYTPLLPATKIGRHLIWSNFVVTPIDIKTPRSFFTASLQEIKDYYGIQFDDNLYYEGNHAPEQVLRNCVHPELGLHILRQAFKNNNVGKSSLPEQGTMF